MRTKTYTHLISNKVL